MQVRILTQWHRAPFVCIFDDEPSLFIIRDEVVDTQNLVQQNDNSYFQVYARLDICCRIAV